MEKYEKVLDLMKSKGGRIELNDPELLVILNRDAKGKKNLVYRISAYMYSIRHVAQLEVRGVREGRKVVAYELVAATPETPGVMTEQDSGSVSEQGQLPNPKPTPVASDPIPEVGETSSQGWMV